MQKCVSEHWTDERFVMLKVDLTYAVNMVSRQWILNEYEVHFPVRQQLVSAIGDDKESSEFGLQCWYIDDGALAGYLESVLRPLTIIQLLGLSLGLNINQRKYELFGAGDLSQFPSCIPSSSVPKFELLGSPIGGDEFCSHFMTMKISAASVLLSHHQEVGTIDSHVAFVLLHFFGGFSKLSYITRTTPLQWQVQPSSSLIVLFTTVSQNVLV